MRTITQIIIDTPDAEKLASFYRTFFWILPEPVGADPKEKQTGWLLKFDGTTSLLLVQNAGDSGRAGRAQFTLSVGSEEEVDSLAASMVRGGASMVQAPRKTHGIYRCSFADPDGNLIFITA